MLVNRLMLLPVHLKVVLGYLVLLQFQELLQPAPGQQAGPLLRQQFNK
jgi:hypothetical protein